MFSAILYEATAAINNFQYYSAKINSLFSQTGWWKPIQKAHDWHQKGHKRNNEVMQPQWVCQEKDQQ